MLDLSNNKGWNKPGKFFKSYGIHFAKHETKENRHIL
jgi:hypothetical protein